MNQDSFIAKHQADWDFLYSWLEGKGAAGGEDIPRRYRQLCQHLALAQSRRYSPSLIERLETLTLAVHRRFYRRPGHLLRSIGRYVAWEFPRNVRREWRLLALSLGLFYGPLIGLLVAVQWSPELVYSVLPVEQVHTMEQMYDPARKVLGRERGSDSDFEMFGFYIANNTGIGFRTFAAGLLFGLGSAFFLVYNGVVLGAVAGYLTDLGFIQSFWGFVVGHSAFELTAVVLSGTAGLRLGFALLAPGRRSRRLALIEAGRDGMGLLYGAAGLFILAAFVEAFWSSTTWPPVGLKYAVGALLWALTVAYFLLLGRGRGT